MWKLSICKIILSFILLFINSNYALETRIIGGTEVDIAGFPYLVSIRYRSDNKSQYLHECGGVIYNERTVITSAYCVHKIDENNGAMIVAGANKRISTDGMPYPISKWIAHPQFSRLTLDYDIGLIIIDDKFVFQPYRVSAINIAENWPAYGAYGTIAGWGYREEFGPSSYTLESTKVPIVNTTECNALYGAGEITERMICAGYVISGGHDGCHGDSGGPLVCEGELVGLNSWGRGCGRPFYPGVYSFVPNLKTWVDENIPANM